MSSLLIKSILYACYKQKAINLPTKYIIDQHDISKNSMCKTRENLKNSARWLRSLVIVIKFAKSSSRLIKAILGLQTQKLYCTPQKKCN